MKYPTQHSDSSKAPQAAVHVLLPKELHRKFKLAAVSNGETMNSVIIKMIETYLLKNSETDLGDKHV